MVALVVGGAILLTGWIVSGTSPTGPDDTTPTSAAPDIDANVVLACVPALETACGEAARTLGVAAESWEPGDALPERGVLLAPAGDLPDGVEVGPVVAESPIVIAGWLTRWEILSLSCGDVVDANCVAGSMGRSWADLGGNESWGDFKVGLADPTTSESGFLAWSYFGPAAQTNPDGVGSTLRTVLDDDAELMEELVLFPSRADIVVTTEVAVAGQFQNAIDRAGARLQIGYPAAGPWVEYVAVGQGRGSDSLIEELGGEQISAVFSQAGLRPVTGVAGSLPDGLGQPGDKAPSPDDATRATLIGAWEDIR